MLRMTTLGAVVTALVMGFCGLPSAASAEPVPLLFARCLAPPATPAGLLVRASHVGEEGGGIEYYEIALIPTGNVSGTGRAGGRVAVGLEASAFGVALTADGRYRLALEFIPERLRPAADGYRYVAWVTTPELDIRQALGTLDTEGSVTGTVEWNRFLVVVTLEDAATDPGSGWLGPVVLRGMSRSGKMHTMAGHGPFEVEQCAVRGFR